MAPEIRGARSLSGSTTFKHTPTTAPHRHTPILAKPSIATTTSATTATAGPISALQIRRATASDFWSVSDMHCAAFYPRANSFWQPLLRIDRVLSLHVGSERQGPGVGKFLCLVATDEEEGLEEELRVKERTLGPILDAAVDLFFPKTFKINYCASHIETGTQGAIVLDTLADHLPPRRVEINGVIRELRRSGIAYISNLAVSPTAQRRGIGMKLLQTAEQVAKEWGCRSVALHVDPVNVAAVELYKGAGYKVAGSQSEWQRIFEGRATALTLMMKVLPKKRQP